VSTTAMLDASPAVQVGNNPRELRALPQWVCWRFEDRGPDHKAGKVPTNPHTGRNASSTNPKTWGTFDEAMDARESWGLDGVCFVLSEHDPLRYDRPGPQPRS
jgi:primase-polymerase (primpol)-like protein